MSVPRAAARAAAARPAVRPAGPPREVRLIGGSLRGRKLPVADRPGLRPTPDRVRETLFNWLGQELAGWRVLDAFAGSGALGFEAASRGAAEVWLLESDPALVRSLRDLRERFGVPSLRVERAEALAWMRRAPAASFELVLLDPPFDSGLAAPALEAARALVVPGGWIYLEASIPLQVLPAGLHEWRRLRAGAVSAQLLRVD